MRILGINNYHDASICLLDDNNINVILEEERFSRIKKDDVVCKSLYEISKIIDSVDFVVHHDLSGRNFKNIIDKYIRYNSFIDFGNTNHHLFHASSSFYNSGFDEAVCLIMDGTGSPFFINEMETREIESVYYAKYPCEFSSIFKHYSSRNYPIFPFWYDDKTFISNSVSVGKTFIHATKYCELGDAGCVGKTMGLSPYGKTVNENLYIDSNGILITDPRYITHWEGFSPSINYPKEDLALWVQEQTYKVCKNLIEKYVLTSNTNNLCLSGGYFLNCVNNYRLLGDFPQLNIFIDPLCYDAGISVGAAKYHYYSLTQSFNKKELSDIYLGNY
jgi:carbamoyltransferase